MSYDILATPDQPSHVLVEYIEYVEGKIYMREVPFNFTEWAQIELENKSPVSEFIKIEE